MYYTVQSCITNQHKLIIRCYNNILKKVSHEHDGVQVHVIYMYKVEVSVQKSLQFNTPASARSKVQFVCVCNTCLLYSPTDMKKYSFGHDNDNIH